MRQLLGRVERKHDFTAVLLIYFVVLYVHLKKQFSIIEIKFGEEPNKTVNILINTK